MRPKQLLLLFSMSCIALSQGSSSGLSTLKLPTTTFILSTGDAFVADAGINSVRSLYINPANIGSSINHNILFCHTQWIQNTGIDHLTAMLPSKYGNFALSINNSSVNDIQLHGNQPGPAIGTFNAQSTLFQLTYALKINEYFIIGLAPKYIYEKIFIDDATGYAFDAGVLYTTKIKELQLGLSITNLGKLSAFRTEKVNLPSQFRIGGTYDFNIEKITCRFASALSYEFNNSKKYFGTGLEAIYNNLLFMRFGIKTGYYLQNYSLGIGLRYNIFTFDYSYLPFRLQAGNVHSFSFEFTL